MIDEGVPAPVKKKVKRDLNYWHDRRQRFLKRLQAFFLIIVVIIAIYSGCRLIQDDLGKYQVLMHFGTIIIFVYLAYQCSMLRNHNEAKAHVRE